MRPHMPLRHKEDDGVDVVLEVGFVITYLMNSLLVCTYCIWLLLLYTVLRFSCQDRVLLITDASRT